VEVAKVHEEHREEISGVHDLKAEPSLVAGEAAYPDLSLLPIAVPQTLLFMFVELSVKTVTKALINMGDLTINSQTLRQWCWKNAQTSIRFYVTYFLN